MPKIIVICGPTTSGKSDAAIQLAKKINGEIISADSRQIYRGMDLGTGKIQRDKSSQISNFKFRISKQEEKFFCEGIRHYLIDIAEPMEEFNVSHFQGAAKKAIDEIIRRGKIPIICGGTGFWIRALVDGMELPEVKPNTELRNMLRNKSAQELFEQLQKIDPERAKNIDSKNHVRLIRAIEIAKELGKVPDHRTWNMGHGTNEKYNFLQIGIEVSKEILDEKIKKRLEDRFKQGMIKEVEALIKKGVNPEWLERIGLEYRWIARYLQKEISLEDMKEKLYFDIIHYAKRQMTWFKKDKRILWFKTYPEIEQAIKKFLA